MAAASCSLPIIPVVDSASKGDIHWIRAWTPQAQAFGDLSIDHRVHTSRTFTARAKAGESGPALLADHKTARSLATPTALFVPARAGFLAQEGFDETTVRAIAVRLG
jgi:hypothetical protein